LKKKQKVGTLRASNSSLEQAIREKEKKGGKEVSYNLKTQ